MISMSGRGVSHTRISISASGIWASRADTSASTSVREFADGRCLGERQWHMDIEDRHTLKLIVYLSDVDGGSGPFQYMSRATTDRVRADLGYFSGFVSDERMLTVSEPHEWQRVLGPTFTAAIADPCNLFHRGQPPTTTDRYSMTFSYCSRRPDQVLTEYLPTHGQGERMRPRLTVRQRMAVGFG